MHPDNFSISDADFENAMHEIDAELRAESPLFRGRELKGWMKFCIKFGLDEVRMDHPLSKRIYAWFTAMYGDRLNIDFDLGRTVVHLNSDLYAMRCVRSFGTVVAICSPTFFGVDLGSKVRTDGTRPASNILNYVSGLTAAMASRLSSDNCKVILDTYCEAFLTFLALEAVFDQKHIKEAIDDCQTAVDSLFMRIPNYGLSRYHSLQAVEKVLKSFLVSKGKSPAQVHSLSELTRTAYVLGLPELDPGRIDEVQCGGGVRYNASESTKDQAVIAHYSSFDLIREIGANLPRKGGYFTVVSAQFQIHNSSEVTPAAGLVNLPKAPRKS
jgi:hypothetical protein